MFSTMYHIRDTNKQFDEFMLKAVDENFAISLLTHSSG